MSTIGSALHDGLAGDAACGWGGFGQVWRARNAEALFGYGGALGYCARAIVSRMTSCTQQPGHGSARVRGDLSSWFVLASWPDMDQKSADKFICGQRHGGMATRTFEAVIFDAEGDALRIKTDQEAVESGDPVGVAA